MSAVPFDPFARTVFGYPRALATLFFTEMWERFSFYGMRALLVLFMIAPESQGGLGYGAAEAAGIAAIYGALVYLTPLPGGWIADRVVGARRAVLYGGIVIAAGHIVLAVFGGAGLFPALILIILGTGLLKPNLTAMVGGLYAGHDEQRDAGFSIYYMGINLGALLAPLVCGYLGQEVSWELGFGVAAVGMILALVQYVLGARGLGPIGVEPENPLAPAQRRRFYLWSAVALVVFAALVALELAVVRIPADSIELGITLVIVAIPIYWFARTLRQERGRDVEQFNRVIVLGVLFAASAVFWLVSDQAGSTITIFAQDDTRHTLFGVHFPSSWFQTVNPLLIIVLAPVMASLWTVLAARNRQPGTAAKFGGSLILVFASMVVMVLAAQAAQSGQVAAMWLVAVFAIQTVAELMLSPVGLSAASRLAPPDRVSQTIGVWFLATSVGDAIGGRLAQYYDQWGQVTYFAVLGVIALVAGIAMLAVVKPLRRLLEE